VDFVWYNWYKYAYLSRNNFEGTQFTLKYNKVIKIIRTVRKMSWYHVNLYDYLSDDKNDCSKILKETLDRGNQITITKNIMQLRFMKR